MVRTLAKVRRTVKPEAWKRVTRIAQATVELVDCKRNNGKSTMLVRRK